MDKMQSRFVMDGDQLLKRFEMFIDQLESELCHEMLPVPLQEVAVRGLRTMTGYDMEGWRGYKNRLVQVLDAAKEGNYETTKEEKSEWQKQLMKLEKFMSLIPSEATRFYNDEVREEVKPLCEVSTRLIKNMIEWLEMVDGSKKMSYAIQVEGLKKSYNDHTVLKGINFSVNKGEIFALLGVNGAGKTTTLECIEGLRKYDSGSIKVSGKTGVQLQTASIPEHMRAMEAVHLFAKWNKVVLDQSMLKALGILDLARKQYGELSTGQKRRLHLALALVRDPEIVFLDEPTAGLDVEARIFLHEEIRKLRDRGKTIIMASHDMIEVESLCNRIAILRDGEVAFIGTAQELTDHLGQQSIVEIKTVQGVEHFVTDNFSEILLTQLEKYKRNGVTVLDVKVDRGTLEEHFINISRGGSI